jgi:hypothetical protein
MPKTLGPYTYGIGRMGVLGGDLTTQGTPYSCDALRCSGPHARYTDRANEFPPWPRGLGNLGKLCRAGDRALQLLLFNEESLVSASHQLALITSLPFVHTARRYYRLNGSVRPSDRPREGGNTHPGLGSCPNSVI